MFYSRLVDAYESISKTTKRLEITSLLVGLLRQTPPTVIDKVVYLTQGKLYPDYLGIEVGIAEKLAIKCISAVAGTTEQKVTAEYKAKGDLGTAVEELLDKKTQAALQKKPLTVEDVYTGLDRIARSAGSGSVESKIRQLTGMLGKASPVEAKYLIRTALGRLRLGVADMTILDALSQAFASGKASRTVLEQAYNRSSDLGLLSKRLAAGGIKEIESFKITVGIPVRPMLAERLPDAKEILEKMDGTAAAEYKYDGLRIQAHLSPEGITMFSRRLENITEQFPDVEKLVRSQCRLGLSRQMVVKSAEQLDDFMQQAIADGCEGLMIKSVGPDSIYTAGSRGWAWIKYKREYKSEMQDTVDLAVVGAFAGRGRRGGAYGALLLAAYDKKEDMFKTVCKCGSGFTDEDLAKLPGVLDKYKADHKHARVDSKIEADVWFVPGLAIEVIGAEITLSPIHTCGMNAIRPGAGLAIRFPRFTGRYRTEKAPEDATTAVEIIEMYNNQLKKIESKTME